MGLPDDDRRALRTRLAPNATAAADMVAAAVEDGEELREVVVDAHGDVVAFTDRRALFVAASARRRKVVPIAYDAIELRRRAEGLAIDALLEGDRLVLEVARGTFVRLAVVGAGGPPGRATWLPAREPRPAPEPPPPAVAPASSAPPTPSPAPVPAPVGAGPSPFGPVAPPPPPGERAEVPGPPVPPPAPAPPAPPPAGLPAAGWHPDPAGRHWWRWWDGVDWTEHVADGGSPFIDPLPPRP